MKAFFSKNSVTPNLQIKSDDQSISISIAADDSCGRLPQYSRFSVWYVDKNRNIDDLEDGFDLPKVIYWLTKISAKR